MARKPASAFTLIELLVVISIISLLVAILLPALSQARKIAQRAACLSQVRGINTGAHMYSNDNRYLFPPNHRNPTNSYGITDAPVDSSWAAAYRRGFYMLSVNYVSSYDTFYCPSNAVAAWADRDAFTQPVASIQSSRGTYMWRYVKEDGTSVSADPLGFSNMARPDVGQRFASANPSLGYPAGFVLSPSKTAYMADLVHGYRSNVAPVNTGLIGQVHVEGVNAAFFDGHGEFRRHDPLATLNISSDANNYFYGFTHMIDIRR